MKFKSVILLAVAVGCGLVAMLGVQQVLSGNKDASKSMAKVLIATAEIGPGLPLNEHNCELRDWPANAVPDGAVRSRDQYVDRAITVRAVPGEIIMQAKLGEKGVFGAANAIPDGMRVVTVPVDMSQNISGLLLPNDRVDILSTYKTRDQNRGYMTRTKTVLENVKVFATDNRRDMAASGGNTQNTAKNLSFLVTPEQANVLKLAESMGKLHIALRPRDDEKIANADEADSGDFHGEQKEPEPEAKPKEEPEKEVVVATTEKPKWQIEIFAGDKRIVEEVELPTGAKK